MKMNVNIFIGLSIVKYYLKKLEIVENFEKIIYMYCFYYFCLIYIEKIFILLYICINFFGYRNMVLFVMFYSIKKLIEF